MPIIALTSLLFLKLEQKKNSFGLFFQLVVGFSVEVKKLQVFFGNKAKLKCT